MKAAQWKYSCLSLTYIQLDCVFYAHFVCGFLCERLFQVSHQHFSLQLMTLARWWSWCSKRSTLLCWSSPYLTSKERAHEVFSRWTTCISSTQHPAVLAQYRTILKCHSTQQQRFLRECGKVRVGAQRIKSVFYQQNANNLPPFPPSPTNHHRTRL